MNMKRLRRLLIMVAALLSLGILISACGSEIQPSIAQYAITTGHGTFSNQQVLNVTAPGDNVHLGSGTTTWYVWADARNYVTAPSNGDRGTPQAELTGAGANGLPGMSDYTWTYVTWEINPAVLNKDQSGQYPVASQFLAFCLKYGCADQQAQNDSSNAGQTRSVSAGWEAMLNEVLPRAIDNATKDAITAYKPDLWTNRGEWSTFGNAIAAALPAEIAKLDGSSVPYFCGPGSTTTSCTAPEVIVQNVTPSDPAVVSAYNQEVAAQYAQQAGAARLAAAKEIYGSDANYFLGVQDTINACSSKGVTCNIYLGSPPVHP